MQLNIKMLFICLIFVLNPEASLAQEILWGTASSGGGDGSTASPPAPGVDTALTLYENSERSGDNVVEFRIDATTDLINDTTFSIGRLGLLTQQVHKAFIDGNDHAANVEGYVRFGMAVTNTNSNSYELFHGTSLNNTKAVVVPTTGGRLKAEALSVYNWSNNSANSAVVESCTYEVRYSDSITEFAPTTTPAGPPPVNPGVLGADSGWNACPNTVESGFGSSNTGGVGDSALGYFGTHYSMPQTGCTCATDDCVMIVAVKDRNSVDVCDQVEDVYLRLITSEVTP